MTIKKTKQNVMFVETSFIRHLAALKPILGHWKRGSLTHSMLITTLFQVLPEVHRQPRNNVGSHSMTERISRIRAGNLLILNITLYHCVTHPESVREKIVHLLAVNLTIVMITWGRSSIIYDLMTCDINFGVWSH